MKKILLIGKLNNAIKDINEYLSKYFKVQLTTENINTVEGMLKIMRPDLVVINLIGLYGNVDEKIFFLLNNSYSDIPVITIGTETECSYYLKYYEQKQFINLIRPLSNSNILKSCFERLKMEEKEAEIIKEERKNILLVDDSPVTLRAIKKIIEPYYETTVAISGAQAIKAIGKKCPDLIILDYEMPVCDGEQTLKMIRADKQMHDIPVIFLTGVADKAHIESVLKLRPADYLLKPVPSERLLEAINNALN